MIPRRVVRAMGWLRRTGTTVVLVDGGGEAEAAGEEERGGVDAHDLMEGGGGRGSVGRGGDAFAGAIRNAIGSSRMARGSFEADAIFVATRGESRRRHSRCSRGSRWTSQP